MHFKKKHYQRRYNIFLMVKFNQLPIPTQYRIQNIIIL